MSSLDAWKARSIFELDLPSGVHVKGKFIDMEMALMGGGFDFSILKGLTQADPDGAPDPEALAEGLRYKRFVVCSCLLEVDGEDVALSEDDYALIPEEDRTAFFERATHKTPLALGA